jgi:hypothetical protein
MTVRFASPGARLLSVALLLLACSTESLAQQGRIPSGTRVRILAPAFADTLMVGTIGILRVDGKLALALLPEAGDRTDWILIPSSEIGRLEVSRGHPSDAREGALVGAVFGGLAGAYLVSRTECSRDTPDLFNFCGPSIVLGSLAGGGAGAMIGTMWGASRITGPERWQVRPVPSR